MARRRRRRRYPRRFVGDVLGATRTNMITRFSEQTSGSETLVHTSFPCNLVVTRPRLDRLTPPAEDRPSTPRQPPPSRSRSGAPAELKVSHNFRRQTTIAQRFGDIDCDLKKRYAALEVPMQSNRQCVVEQCDVDT